MVPSVERVRRHSVHDIDFGSQGIKKEQTPLFTNGKALYILLPAPRLLSNLLTLHDAPSLARPKIKTKQGSDMGSYYLSLKYEILVDSGRSTTVFTFIPTAESTRYQWIAPGDHKTNPIDMNVRDLQRGWCGVRVGSIYCIHV